MKKMFDYEYILENTDIDNEVKFGFIIGEIRTGSYEILNYIFNNNKTEFIDYLIKSNVINLGELVASDSKLKKEYRIKIEESIKNYCYKNTNNYLECIMNSSNKNLPLILNMMRII